MMPQAKDHEQIRRYLLGNLSQEIRHRIEQRLLTEDRFLEELLLAEEELIDDYVGDALTEDARSKFDQHFLSTPERQQKLRFALALTRYVSNSSETTQTESANEERPISRIKPTWTERFRAFGGNRNWGWRVGAALAAVAIIAVALWLARPRTPSPQTFATLTLNISVSSDRAEGAQASKVKLPLQADALKISLMLPEQLPQPISYRVELMNNEGQTRSLSIIGEDARSISVVIPASQLTRDRYALRLYTVSATGTEQRVPGNYFFSVE